MSRAVKWRGEKEDCRIQKCVEIRIKFETKRCKIYYKKKKKKQEKKKRDWMRDEMENASRGRISFQVTRTASLLPLLFFSFHMSKNKNEIEIKENNTNV